ncbi:MAG TPA: hypothetical protein VEA36_01315 [Candidatus Paceibacterota bacterium]|nr:hypothetical protein [Candidatus Paceibacterota bacterium]
MKRNRKLWFRAKRFGWGWYPASWQGWAVTVAYTLLYVLSGLLFGAFAPAVVAEGGSVLEGSVLFASLLVLITASLLAICYRYGERPRWRWG